MYSLDKAVDLVSRWPSSKQKSRPEAVSLVDALIARCQDAVKVWKEYAGSSGAPGDRFSLVSWVGAARARTLFDIHLAARRDAQRLCDLAGPAAGRLLGLDEDVIEMAYRQLGEGETGAQAAQTALDRLDKRIQYLSGLKRRLSAAPASASRPAAKKAAPKKAATRKKPAAKKAAKKKK
jgi:cell division septum initiation protein DivIVA